MHTWYIIFCWFYRLSWNSRSRPFPLRLGRRTSWTPKYKSYRYSNTLLLLSHDVVIVTISPSTVDWVGWADGGEGCFGAQVWSRRVQDGGPRGTYSMQVWVTHSIVDQLNWQSRRMDRVSYWISYPGTVGYLRMRLNFYLLYIGMLGGK